MKTFFETVCSDYFIHEPKLIKPLDGLVFNKPYRYSYFSEKTKFIHLFYIENLSNSHNNLPSLHYMSLLNDKDIIELESFGVIYCDTLFMGDELDYIDEEPLKQWEKYCNGYKQSYYQKFTIPKTLDDNDRLEELFNLLSTKYFKSINKDYNHFIFSNFQSFKFYLTVDDIIFFYNRNDPFAPYYRHFKNQNILLTHFIQKTYEFDLKDLFLCKNI
jgi:hypothetical protein